MLPRNVTLFVHLLRVPNMHRRCCETKMENKFNKKTTTKVPHSDVVVWMPLGCNFKDNKGIISTSNLSWRGRYLLLAVKIEKAHQAMQRDERLFTELFVFGKSYLGKNITQKDNNDNKIFDLYSNNWSDFRFFFQRLSVRVPQISLVVNFRISRD